MDTIDRPDSNMPARLPLSSSRLPAHVPVFPQELMTAPVGGTAPTPITAKVILRGLVRHWWRILLLWLVISAPLAYLIFKGIEPTYQAFSNLEFKLTQNELFDIQSRQGETNRDTYLRTQAVRIMEDQVLEAAIQQANVAKLPLIAEAEDPKAALREYLVVEPQRNTTVIRVSMEYKSPKDATDIVNAVVGSYVLQYENLEEKPRKSLAKELEQYLKELEENIKKQRDDLADLLKKGNIQTQHTSTPDTPPEGEKEADSLAFSSWTEDEYRRTLEEMRKVRFARIEVEAMLKARQDAELAQIDESTGQQPADEALKQQIVDAFYDDPAVIDLTSRLKQAEDVLKQIQQKVRLTNDMAVVTAKRKVKELREEYNSLWDLKESEIRQRLLAVNKQVDPRMSFGSITELTSKVAGLKAREEFMQKLVDDAKFENGASGAESARATFAKEDLAVLLKMRTEVHRRSESLRFETERLPNQVRVSPAVVPTAPYENKRIKYMTAVFGGVMFMMLGLFSMLEIKSERVADPDLLSTRVQSEVYALPPLPQSRAIRKLRGPANAELTDRFKQRLDHLRFAICGDSAEMGKGRCVLVTSAIGGEGKTTLAAQLAGRCGDAGISTLLIDADLRRAALGPLLDISEGPGLSDVLNETVDVESAVIPIQEGVFSLLPAGTPVDDTSRMLQSRSLGLLIARLRQLYDLIIIDSPPVLPIPDALILGRWTDGALMAARYDISRSPQVERATRQLNNAGIAILGTVINGMRDSDSYYGRYSYSRRSAPQPETPNVV